MKGIQGTGTRGFAPRDSENKLQRRKKPWSDGHGLRRETDPGLVKPAQGPSLHFQIQHERKRQGTRANPSSRMSIFGVSSLPTGSMSVVRFPSFELN
jgi:hypothetical protein